MLKQFIIFLSISFLIITILPITTANPPPPKYPPPAENSDGGPLVDEICNIKFISENVTIYINSGDAQIIANYTFINKLNQSINQQLLLPFYSKPNNILITAQNQELNFKWTKYFMNITKDKNTNFNLIYDAAQFTVPFRSLETVTVEVEYFRNYCYHIYYENDIYYNLIYLTRTGALWDEPIQYANFEFYVSRQICTGTFKDNSSYLHFHRSEYYYYPDYDLYAVAYLTEFLTRSKNINNSYFYLNRTYYNWVPKQDIGVTWIIKKPNLSIDISCELSKGQVNIKYNANRSFDPDGYIESFVWGFGDGNYSKDIITNHTYNKTGKYSISLSATDNMDCSSHISKRICIYSLLDEIVFNVSKLTGISIEEFYLYPENYFKWILDDRDISQELEITKTFSNPGIYKLRLEYFIYGYSATEEYLLIIIEFDTDNDSIFDESDAFPFDPSASIDTDGDGYPDMWNPGMTEINSTSGLVLDSNPENPLIWDENTDNDDDESTDNTQLIIVLITIVVFILIILSIISIHEYHKRKDK